jgi:hypothetical protein
MCNGNINPRPSDRCARLPANIASHPKFFLLKWNDTLREIFEDASAQDGTCGGPRTKGRDDMFGTLVVSLTGIALPILAGVWFTPRSEGNALDVLSPIVAGARRDGRLLRRRGTHYLGSLAATLRPRHLPSSAGRAIRSAGAVAAQLTSGAHGISACPISTTGRLLSVTPREKRTESPPALRFPKVCGIQPPILAGEAGIGGSKQRSAQFMSSQSGVFVMAS